MYKKKKKKIPGPLRLSGKKNPPNVVLLQVLTTQLTKMSIEPEFVELTADVTYVVPLLIGAFDKIRDDYVRYYK